MGYSTPYLKMSKEPRLDSEEAALGSDPLGTRKLYHHRKIGTEPSPGNTALVKRWGYSKMHLMLCKVTKCLVVGLVSVMVG